ncbi:MAG TPA: hypothetical protein VF456_13005 [Vicinamibacterales bacterium]
MTEQYQPIANLLARVRVRWRRLVAFRAARQAALLATVSLLAFSALASLTTRAPFALAAIGMLAALLVAAALVRGLLPLRDAPSDARIARFIEERRADLDERLVSAVSVIEQQRIRTASSGLAASMVGDAARAASTVDPAEIVASEVLRRAGIQAVAAVLLFAATAFFVRDKARQSFDAAALALFPAHIVLEVTPGDARVQAGSNLTVVARLVGNAAPVVAQLFRSETGNDNDWQATEMPKDASGRFALALNSLSSPFHYKVVAGTVTSKTYAVNVVRPPRVKSIDVEYTYPPALGLAPRVEEDGGDIYAPAGTDVRVLVHTDVPAASGHMVLGPDKQLDLEVGSDRILRGSMKLLQDGSYRVALADAEGLSTKGDTEYFIRTMEDRPPEVHVVKPASDRRVTKLEEVTIEAEASDDFGISAFDLVYAVRGGPEKVIPFPIPQRAASVTGRHTMFLEDLDVAPGDFVSYYVRARDLARGKASSETRSDIFFLDVKPFEEEFTLAQTSAAMGGGRQNQQVDDLVAAQKQVIVATWKLDRRSQAAKGAQSEEDIRSVSKAESELKTRVEQASSSFRQSTMRDPRARPTTGRGQTPAPPPVRAGQTLVEEDDMVLAANAMSQAVTSLDALKTKDAVGPELEALNHLLKAQADVKQRQIQQQQAGGRGGGNRNIEDMSSLFDKELARHQQTNYETPKSAAQDDEKASAIDKIKDLARRQDELLQRQQDFTRNRDQMNAEELKRQLESLTREQNELRQRAEELAQQLARQQSGQSGQQNQQQNGQQSGQQSQSGQPQAAQAGQQSGGGQPNRPGQQGQTAQRQGQSGQPGQQGQSGQNDSQSARSSSQGGKEMRDVSEAMRNATNELGRQQADQASANAAKALEKLRDLEHQLEATTPDGRRRALGDLQLEARQLADAERQIAAESKRAGQSSSSDASKDALRRLAGEQDRLADRLNRVQDGLKQQANPSAAASGGKDANARNLQEAAANAAREMDRQRLGERMQQSAEAMRAASGQPDAKANGKNPAAPSSDGTPGSQEDIARALDRLADSLTAAARQGDDESHKLSSNLSRAQELRERLDSLSRQLDQLNQQKPSDQQASSAQNGRSGQQNSSPSSQTPGQSGSKPGQGQGGSGGSSTDVGKIREDLNREVQEVRALIDQMHREDPSYAQGGSGLTFEGQGMTLSAPGTESFKQDFARWQEMKRQVSAALEQVETTLAKKLQERNAKDRLSAGADDQAPAAYQQQVDSYFKALATRKKQEQ